MDEPWVTSGSSPASLMTIARAESPSWRTSWIGSGSSSPLGKRIETDAGTSFPNKANKAALLAAVAQDPVVNPLRKG